MTLFQKQFRIETARCPGWNYGSRGWYFVTICTKDKKCCLGTVTEGAVVFSKAGVIADSEMWRIADHYSNVSVDRFVIMPNHVHMLIVLEGQHSFSPALAGDGPSLDGPRLDGASPVSTKRARSLADVVGGYKAGVSRICRVEGIADFAWQARFHDHILRGNASVNGVRDYIERNPENWMNDPDGRERDGASPISTVRIGS